MLEKNLNNKLIEINLRINKLLDNRVFDIVTYCKLCEKEFTKQVYFNIEKQILLNIYVLP